MATALDQSHPDPEKVLWCCVARNDVILAEAGRDHFHGLVAETAQALLAKRGTAGWEYNSSPRPLRLPFRKKGPGNGVGGRGNGSSSQGSNMQQPSQRLKGVKFHLVDLESDAIVWVFAAVYDPQNVELAEVQSFLEKIVGITEMYRDEDDRWRNGGTLACQESFAPILLQRMEDVTYLGKMAMLSEQLETSKQIMQDNITRILEREERLEDLADRGTRLEQMAAGFKKQTKQVRRRMMLQNAKHGIVMGTAITAGVAVVVVPPLVAIL